MKIINRLSSLIIVQMKCDTVGQGRASIFLCQLK